MNCHLFDAKKVGLVLGLLALSVSAVVGQTPIPMFSPVVDGVVDGGYGAPISVQTAQTDFGDELAGTLGGAGGGELDALYLARDATHLYVMASGNRGSDNNIYVLIDNVAETGGVSGVLPDIAGGDMFATNGLWNSDGIGGMTVPAGFNTDFGIAFKAFTGASGTRFGGVEYVTPLFLLDVDPDGVTGATGTDTAFALFEVNFTTGPPPTAITFPATGVHGWALDNSNVLGVDGGTAANTGGDPAVVTTGAEMKIALVDIPGTIDDSTVLNIIVMLVNGQGNFISNQFLPPLPPQANLGTNEDIAAAGATFASVAFGVPVLPFETTFDDAASESDFGLISSFGDTTLATINANSDTEIQFGFDYSTLLFGGGSSVGEAPNTGGAAATRGVFIRGNATTGTPSGVAFYFTEVLSGDWRATFDYFDAYNGGGGSTEEFWVGINTSGSNYIGETGGTDNDGYLFEFNGDYDTIGADAFFVEGATGGYNPDQGDSTPDGAGTLVGVTWGDGQNADAAGRDILAPVIDLNPIDGLEDLFVDAMPNSVDGGGAARPGGLINTWTEVEVLHISGRVTISLNGTTFVSYDDPDDSFPSGNLMLVHEDIFGSQSDNHTGVFDNLSIEEIITTAVGGYSLYR